MTEPERPATAQRATPSGITRVLEHLAELASSVRRLPGNDDYDAKGVRTIWHRGKTCEMLSWENREGTVLKQELTVMTLVIEYKHPSKVSTGRIPQENTAKSQAASHLITMDAAPAQMTLEAASEFLKHVPNRDYYAQHLLKQVNETLTAIGLDGATAVSNLGAFGREMKRRAQVTAVADEKPSPRWPWWALAMALGLAATAALLFVAL